MSYKFVKINPPFDIRKNFWDENFQLTLIEPFRSIYERDSSLNKTTSSKEMWCIWLSCDPTYDNKVYRLKDQEKKSAILTYYPQFDFNDPLLITAMVEYKEQCLSPAAKAFIEEENTMIKRSNFISTAEYTFDSFAVNSEGKQLYNKLGSPIIIKGSAKELDTMRKMTTEIVSQYEKVRRAFEEEQSMVRLHGGGRESLFESGDFAEIPDDDEGETEYTYEVEEPEEHKIEAKLRNFNPQVDETKEEFDQDDDIPFNDGEDNDYDIEQEENNKINEEESNDNGEAVQTKEEFLQALSDMDKEHVAIQKARETIMNIMEKKGYNSEQNSEKDIFKKPNSGSQITLS